MGLARPVTVAVISDYDAAAYQLLRDWAGTSDDIDYVLDPRDLDDLATKLETLGQGHEIERLVFMGHGDSQARGLLPLRRADGGLMTPETLRKLHQGHPRLADVFAPDASLLFVNCRIGRNEDFIKAAGSTFLGRHGGRILANTQNTIYLIGKDEDGNDIIKWVDGPDFLDFPWFVDPGRAFTEFREGSWEGWSVEPEVGAPCGDVSGTWSQKTGNSGSSVWHITKLADGSYEASESGLGAARGTATLTGRRLKIAWNTGGWSGTYEWTLRTDCQSGRGHLVFKTGERAGEVDWSQVSRGAEAPEPPELSGTWVCTQNCPAGGEGKTAHITQSGDVLEFTNEGGGKSKGRFEGSSAVIAEGWGDLRGTVSGDGGSIRWANGTVWVRR